MRLSHHWSLLHLHLEFVHPRMSLRIACLLHHGSLAIAILVRAGAKGVLFGLHVGCLTPRTHGLYTALLLIVKVVNTGTTAGGRIITARWHVGQFMSSHFKPVIEASLSIDIRIRIIHTDSSRILRLRLRLLLLLLRLRGSMRRQRLFAGILSFSGGRFFEWIFPWSTTFPLGRFTIRFKAKEILGI